MYGAATVWPGEETRIVTAGQRRASRDRAQGQTQAQETLGEMAALLGDTRPSVLIAGGVLAAVTVGAAVEVAALPVPLHASLGSVFYLGILAVVIMSLLRSLALLIVAGRPVVDALGELRRHTGAPVNPAVPWTPVQFEHDESSDLGWDQARALLSAANLRNARVHLALTWAGVTVGFFFAWTFVSLLLAGRI